MNSLAELVRQAVAEHADRPNAWEKDGETLNPITYAEFGQRAQAAAQGLIAAGIEVGEPVVILSENRFEWVVADAAILLVGAVSVPLYPSLPAEQVAPLIARVRARTVICEDAGQLAKLDKVRDEMPAVERIYLFEPKKVAADHPLVRPWAELAREEPALAAELDERRARLTPDHVATIIFTSGTTGVPKGAMLTHGNLLSNSAAAQARIGLRPDDSFVTFLPLSHVFMRIVSVIGCRVGASSLYNESLRALLPNLRRVRPTVLIVVPRFLELIRERVMDGVRQKSGLTGTIANWAMQVAEQIGRVYDEGREPSGWLRFQQKLADKHVFAGIREQLGLDRLRFAVSGGAALPPELGRWFYGIGLTIAQGYGLTETSPAIAVHDPRGRVRFDTIGPPVEGIEVKLADDGELLTRGPHIMQGYFEMPEETAQAIDAEGWFRTGDIAAWTDDGQLKITDRKKNIMVLANGKNVAPQPIESRLSESPYINQILLIGDGQNVVTALIVPQFEAVKQALAQQGENLETPQDIAASAAANKLIRAEISRLSGSLAAFESVRKFRLLAEEFSLEHGELTPTMKLRRKQILERRADLVREMAE